MNTWYKTEKYNIDIELVQAVKSTSASIWVIEDWYGKPREKRHTLHSDWHNYFETFEEAKAFLSKRELNARDYHRGEMLAHEAAIESILALRSPAQSEVVTQ